MKLNKYIHAKLKEGNEEVKKRLLLAVSEIRHFNEYKYVLINDKISNTVKNLIKIIDFLFFVDDIKRTIKNYKIY